LLENTHALLVFLGVTGSTLIAHSTGGMIAVRYACRVPSGAARRAHFSQNIKGELWDGAGASPPAFEVSEP
jgi:pimeloyl-ACP methyl ester carboxylesterase